MKILHMSLFLGLVLAGCFPAIYGNSSNPNRNSNFNDKYTRDTAKSCTRSRFSFFIVWSAQFNPGPEYWTPVGEEIAAKFADAKPAALWIVGILDGEGTYLNFDCKAADPNIRCADVDMNEQTLTLFDEKGFDVWLQVEPGNANVDELIDIVLNQYKHHPSVVGFGVDVEWYQSTNVQRANQFRMRLRSAGLKRSASTTRSIVSLKTLGSSLYASHGSRWHIFYR